MSLLLKRKSIRQFKSKPIAEEAITAMLQSAMQAPSARNQQPWEFVVIKRRDILDQLSETKGGAKPLAAAPLGILLLMREDVGAPSMRPQDMAAATQNLLLEAANLSLGAVWIGVYPREETMDKVRAIITVPKHLLPFAIVAIGHPDQSTNVETLRYDEKRIRVIE